MRTELEASKLSTGRRSGIVHLDRSIVFVGKLEKPREMSKLMFHENEVMSMCISLNEMIQKKKPCY